MLSALVEVALRQGFTILHIVVARSRWVVVLSKRQHGGGGAVWVVVIG